MKVHLLHRDRDVDWSAPLPANHEALTQDLALPVLFAAMAGDDEYRTDVVRRVVLAPLTEPDAIEYRQDVLADCLTHREVVRQLDDLAVNALGSSRTVGIEFLLRNSPDAILRRAVRVMELLLGHLRRLQALAADHAGEFHSEGFIRFLAMLRTELDGEYLAAVEEHLATLRLPDGLLMSGGLGSGNRGVGYVLHRAPHLGWWKRMTGRGERGWSFEIHPRDEAGARALGELEDRGVNIAANALARSVDHVLGFFRILHAELAFYLGCVTLHARLANLGGPTCLPDPCPVDPPTLTARGLYDVALALTVGSRVVGNDVDGDRTCLIMVTGANEGGKSTFLRSVGLAQLMMQSGMVVAAASFSADVRTGVFTHFKREEDATMTHGKLDEELARMSEIADLLGPGALLLCNESFASTNEREGSEIARQVVQAAIKSDVKVVFVTHLYDLAHGLYRECGHAELFLRAEREPSGRRTFRMVPGVPLPTSYGEDSFRRVFTGAIGGPPTTSSYLSADPEIGEVDSRHAQVEDEQYASAQPVTASDL
jgi:hypothetical protein